MGRRQSMSDESHGVTPEQEERLSRIVNVRQRETLLKAIDAGEEIPDYAWTPRPALTKDQQSKMDKTLEPLVERLVKAAHAGVDVNALIGAVGKEEDRRTPAQFDLDFRPVTYWPDIEGIPGALSRIKGTARREAAQSMLEKGEDPRGEPLAMESLTEEQRQEIGAVHPSLMGGEYLPDLDDETEEVEIARVELQSTTGDVFSVRAARDGEEIAYRVVDEYGSEFVIRPESSDRPLALRELVELIDSASDEPEMRGLVVGYWENQLEWSDSPEDAVEFATPSSELYEDLEPYYAARAREWVAQVPESRLDLPPSSTRSVKSQQELKWRSRPTSSNS
jgi:hypothetical protein